MGITDQTITSDDVIIQESVHQPMIQITLF